MKKINLRDFIVTFKKETPLEELLFKLVGLVGVMTSFINGFIYLSLPNHFLTGIICFLAGVFSYFLIIFVQRSNKYLIAYLVTIFAVFMGLFTVLFFLMGANSGYLFLMGMVFTCMLLHGKALAIVLPIQVLWYIGVFIYTYFHPEFIHNDSAPDKNLQMLLIGCLGVGTVICSSMLLYINAYRKANRTAEAATIDALEAGKAKDRFLANMSHEIRTPINTILGMNDMIARESEKENIKDYTEDIRSSGHELLEIIDNILDFSRMGAGKESLHEGVYSTNSLIHKWKFTGENLASKKGLAFSMNVDKRIPAYLYGDEVKINRIVLNLISNAVKYTDFGIVRLNVTVNSLSENEAEISVMVKDTGHGIRKEDIGMLFQSFERLELSKNHKIKGTGLGLAISKELAELMHGTIGCVSEYEKGSEFTFTFPQQVKNEADYTESHDNVVLLNKTIKAPKARVLVVDDSESNRNVISLLLKRTEIKLDMAESGLEALSRYKSNRYDAVLMDYRMSDMDGVETMERIRFLDNDENIHTPVIVVTADVVGDIKERLLAAGFDAFLPKPLNEAALTSILMKFLPKELVTEIDINELTSNEDKHTDKTTHILSGKKVLIVDDEPGMHKIAGGILKDAGCDTVSVDSGEKCLEYLETASRYPEEMPSLILLDINMPGLSGYETFMQIRELNGCAYIPIIFMTSETSVETEVMCMELGAADFIMKPFVRDIMIARISNHISIWDNLKKEIVSEQTNNGFDSKKLELMEKTLSASEYLVAKMIADGYSNREISEKANYSYSYVKKLVSIIFDKLGITKRTEIRQFFK